MDLQNIKRVLKTLPPGFYGGNLYDEQEINAATRVIFNKSPFRHYGAKCTHEAENFERECCEYFQVKHALTTNSGTGALMAALHALDVGPGDEVIVPGFFWVSDSNTVILRGAIPVVAEVDSTFNLDPKDLVKKITKKTKCVIAIHMTGAPADMDAIMTICTPRGIKVLEDFSQCVGGQYKEKFLGTIGDVGIASLQLNKIITSGEGGLIVTNNGDYYTKMTARTDLGYPRVGGISSNTGKDDFVTLGEGRRFNEVSAAIMRVQLTKLPGLLKQLRSSKAAMKQALADAGPFKFRTILDEKGETASILTFIFNTKESRITFMNASTELFPEQEVRLCALIDFGLHIYYNCSNMVKRLPALPGGFPWNLPENANTHSYDKGTLPNTDDLVERTVHIGIPAEMTDLQRDAWIEGLKLIFAKIA